MFTHWRMLGSRIPRLRQGRRLLLSNLFFAKFLRFLNKNLRFWYDFDVFVSEYFVKIFLQLHHSQHGRCGGGCACASALAAVPWQKRRRISMRLQGGGVFVPWLNDFDWYDSVDLKIYKVYVLNCSQKTWYRFGWHAIKMSVNAWFVDATIFLRQINRWKK